MYTIDEQTLRANCRHFSQNMDFAKTIQPYIDEVIQLDIVPQLGEEVLDDQTLQRGGEFETCCGGRRTFAGLDRAVSYYVYARMLRNPNGFLTATGFRQSTDTYSSYAEYKEREGAIVAVKEAADSYMADCIAYVNSVPGLRCKLPCNRKAGRNNISAVIGD